MNNKTKPRQCCLYLICSIVILLAGCGSKAPKVHYYSIVDTTLSTQENPRHPELTVSVGPVGLPGALQQRQISTGGKDGMYIRSDFHRWTGSLDREFAVAIGEQLAANLGTERITIYPDARHDTPDWQVALNIVSMEGTLGEEALLTVRWTLINRKNPQGNKAFRNQFRRIPEQKSYRAWVEGQRQNIQELGAVISKAILDNTEM